MPSSLFFTITIDVEPDCSPSWHYSNPLTFNGVSIGIKEKLQPLFNRYGISPTYLINNVVLEDLKSVEIFNKLTGNFELGTHLHSEFIEPQKEYSTYAGKKGERNQCFLKEDIEFRKMQNITSLFKNCFGYNPVSFRAGRFSAGNNTIACLKKLDYKIDTSVTPHIIWKDKSRQKPVNFRSARENPYFVENKLLKQDKNGSILEVPVTIINKGNWFLPKPRWLRPVYSTVDQLLNIIYIKRKTFRKTKINVLNLMFHNVEVIPKCSPYTNTEEDVTNYLNGLEVFFKACLENGFTSVKLSELHKYALSINN
jgi:hypothetical protein